MSDIFLYADPTQCACIADVLDALRLEEIYLSRSLRSIDGTIDIGEELNEYVDGIVTMYTSIIMTQQVGPIYTLEYLPTNELDNYFYLIVHCSYFRYLEIMALLAGECYHTLNTW
jgi:hypothetical protein